MAYPVSNNYCGHVSAACSCTSSSRTPKSLWTHDVKWHCWTCKSLSIRHCPGMRVSLEDKRMYKQRYSDRNSFDKQIIVRAVAVEQIAEQSINNYFFRRCFPQSEVIRRNRIAPSKARLTPSPTPRESNQSCPCSEWSFLCHQNRSRQTHAPGCGYSCRTSSRR